MGKIVGMLLFFAATSGLAQTNHLTFTYQGELRQGGGPADGTFDFMVTVYDAAQGGTPLFTQEIEDIVVEDGIFSLDIGTTDNPASILFDGSDRWLELGVRSGSEVVAYDFLTPLTRIRATPYAMFALSGNEGPQGPAGDSHWIVDGTATYYTDGFVGIGTPSPLVQLHVQPSEQPLLKTALLEEDILLQAADAVVGLYSNGGGGFGSGLSLGQVSGDGSLDDKWSLVRRTSGAGSELWFGYGTDPSYAVNERTLVLRPGGFAGIGITPAITEEATLTVEAGADQHGVLVHSVEQFGSAIGLHAGPIGYASVAKNGWFNGEQGGWNRFDESMGAYLAETAPDGRTTFFTAGAGANPISFLSALYLEDGNVNVPGTLFLHSVDSPDQFGSLIQFPESGNSVWSLARDTSTGGDMFRVTYSAGDPMLADTRIAVSTVGLAVNRPSTSHPIQAGTDSSNGNGAFLSSGGSWTNGSSRLFKTGFAAIDPIEILTRVVALPVTRWSYRGDQAVEHLGPVAEDFAQAFGLGDDPRYIGTVDADGVALASIQGLYQLIEDKDLQIIELQSREREQRRLLTELLSRIEALEAQQ